MKDLFGRGERLLLDDPGRQAPPSRVRTGRSLLWSGRVPVTPAGTRLRRGLTAVAGVLALAAAAVALYLPLRATASYPVVPVDTAQRAGAYIIDMGVVPQTTQNGLKPYGLVYALTVVRQIPVLWAINGTKLKDGADFTVPAVNGGGAKTYRGGTFVVAQEYATQAKPVIDAWKAANPGMVVDLATADFVIPLFETITSWPNAALDADNGDIAQAYYQLAGIPASAYNWVDPGLPYNEPQMAFPATDRLGRCLDIYVMPHADPTWLTHHSLPEFNEEGGFIWAACHAVSVMENITDPADPDPDADMNFLSVSGLVPFGSHTTPRSRSPNVEMPALVAGHPGLHLAGKLAMLLAMSTTVNIAEFKDRVSEFLALVEEGGEVIVCRRNVPLARVQPICKPLPKKSGHSAVGCMKGTVKIRGDLTEPCIPEDSWDMHK